MNPLPCICLAAAALLIGCDKDDSIRGYQVSKQLPIAPLAADDAAAAPGTSGPIRWKTPPGWTLLPPQELRYAGYSISTADPQAMVTIAEAAGSLKDNIDRWENQLALPPTPEDQIPTLIQDRSVGGETGKLIDLVGNSRRQGGSGRRIRVVIVAHAGTEWFLKMSGSSDVVGQQLENFDAFLESIRFDPAQDATASTTPPDAPSVAPSASDEELRYILPAGWTVTPNPSGVRLLSVMAGSSSAELAVTRFPKDSGTLAQNVERWRGQVGLSPGENPEQATPQKRKVGGDEAMVFDIKGHPVANAPARRLVVALVPHVGDWWFFKLSGPEQAVAEQRGAFNQFLDSVQFRAR